jgi:hypothetical protein
MPTWRQKIRLCGPAQDVTETIHENDAQPAGTTGDSKDHQDSNTESSLQKLVGSEENRKAYKMLANLLEILGKGSWCLAHYRCRQAIKIFNRLPYEQYRSAWVTIKIARAHFEMTEYSKASQS